MYVLCTDQFSPRVVPAVLHILISVFCFLSYIQLPLFSSYRDNMTLACSKAGSEPQHPYVRKHHRSGCLLVCPGIELVASCVLNKCPTLSYTVSLRMF